jgi:hypothetical protein
MAMKLKLRWEDSYATARGIGWWETSSRINSIEFAMILDYLNPPELSFVSMMSSVRMFPVKDHLDRRIPVYNITLT